MPEEQLLNEETKASLKKFFEVLQDEVTMELFIKEGSNDSYNELAGAFLNALAALSDKLKFQQKPPG